MRILKPEGEGRNMFDSHFKNRLRNLEVEPSQGLWDNIENGLNAEREKVKYDHWYPVVLILLAFLTATNLYVNYNFDRAYHATSSNSASDNNTQDLGLTNSLPFQSGIQLPWNNDGMSSDCENSSSPIFIACSNQPKNTANGNTTPFVSDSYSLNNNMQSELSKGLYYAENIITSSELEMEIKKVGVVKNVDNNTSSPLPDNSGHLENHTKRSLEVLRGFHLGFSAGVNTGWLFFREKTLYPIVVDDVKRNFDWGTQYSISFGYDFSHQLGVQADWVFLSKQGYQFEENRFRKIMLNTKIDMSYMHLPVMFKYKYTQISHRTMNPKSLNFLLGVQYSRLRNVEVTMNEREIISEKNVFSSNELGVVMGVEYDFYLHKNYYLTLGARSAISSEASVFNTVNNGGPDSYNVFIGLNAGISYFLPVKGKSK